MLEPIDRECRIFIKALRKTAEKTRRAHVLVEDIRQRTGFGDDTLDAIIEFLVELHILKSNDERGGYTSVYLTQKGRHYAAYRWYEFRSTILFSILLPFIISALSGVLTALLL